MNFQIKGTVRSFLVEIRNKDMPPTGEVTDAITERLHLIHPRIGVRCIPSSSLLSVDQDNALVYEVTIDPADGVEAAVDAILAEIQISLYNTFHRGVEVTSNLTHRH